MILYKLATRLTGTATTTKNKQSLVPLSEVGYIDQAIA